jgi:uncharacterized protein YeaO (DUF488 family)
MLSLKRAYDPYSPQDGQRLLVDRLWPRGVSKDSLKIEQWYRDVAPSAGLRKWFGHDPARWDEFKNRYFAELERNPASWQPILEKARHGETTLIYGARDTEHNDAVALREFLQARLPPD